MPAALCAVIFDVDGTLIDDGLHRDKHNAWLETRPTHRQLAITPAEWRRIGGLTDQHAYDYLVAKGAALGIAPAGWPAAPDYITAVNGWFRANHNRLRLRPGAQAIMATAEACGLPMSVGTNADRAETEAKLAAVGLHRHFGFTSCLNDVIRGKPDPDIYLDALEKISQLTELANPNQVLVIEDTLTGVTAGLAAGCRTVWWRQEGDDQPAPANSNLLVTTDHRHIQALIQNLMQLGRQPVTQQPLQQLACG